MSIPTNKMTAEWVEEQIQLAEHRKHTEKLKRQTQVVTSVSDDDSSPDSDNDSCTGSDNDSSPGSDNDSSPDSDDDSANIRASARWQQPTATLDIPSYKSRKAIQLALDTANPQTPPCEIYLLKSYIDILKEEIKSEKCYSISNFRQGSINTGESGTDKKVGFFSRYMMTGYNIHEKLVVAGHLHKHGNSDGLTDRQKKIARDGLLGNILKKSNNNAFRQVTDNFEKHKSCISNNIIEPLRRTFRRI